MKHLCRCAFPETELDKKIRIIYNKLINHLQNYKKRRQDVITVGLTGGSGSGKGSVASFLLRKGTVCLNADEMYHALTNTSSPCVAELAEKFGPSILMPVGGLDRTAMASLVFCGGDEQKKRLTILNRITHRYVREELEKKIAENRQCGTKFLILDVPLLYESGIDALCDYVVAVVAPYSLRTERIMRRDKLTEQQAKARIDAQPEDAFYLEKADTVIYNNGNLECLRERVEEIYKKLLKLPDTL